MSDSTPLQHVADVFASDAELGELFGLHAEAVDGWREHGVPAGCDGKPPDADLGQLDVLLGAAAFESPLSGRLGAPADAASLEVGEEALACLSHCSGLTSPLSHSTSAPSAMITGARRSETRCTSLANTRSRTRVR